MTLDRLVRPRVFAPLLLLLSALLAWWLWDRTLPNPDEGAYLTAAAKILRGGVFYRDIDAYPFPGSSYLLALAMSLFGEQVAVARGLAAITWCVVVLAVYASAVRLMAPPRAALCGLSLLSLKFWAFPNFTAYFYSDLALASSVVALAVFLRHEPGAPRGRLVVVGVLGGLAVLFKQNTGIYLCAALSLLLLLRARPRETLRDATAFAGGVALVAVPIALYFASEGLLGRMLYSGLVRPFTGYLPTSRVSLLPALAWWELGRSASESPGYLYLPLLLFEMINRGVLWGPDRLWWLFAELYSRILYTTPILVFGLLALRRLRGRAPDAVWASGLVCLAIALSALPRADHPHVVNLYPVVLLTLFSLRTGSRLRIEAGVVALALAISGALALCYDGILTHRLSLDRARLWVRPDDAWVAGVVETARREVGPDEALFVYGHEAYCYFLSDRYFPWPFSQLYPGMAGGDGGRQLRALLLRSRPPLVIEGVRRWPGTPRLESYTGGVRQVLNQRYRDVTEEVVPERERPPRGVLGVLRRR